MLAFSSETYNALDLNVKHRMFETETVSLILKVNWAKCGNKTFLTSFLKGEEY